MTPTPVLITPEGASMELSDTEHRPAIKLATALAGRSDGIRAVVRAISHLAHSPAVAAMVRGEPGVGKEIIARCIHRADSRADIRLVKLDASLFGAGGKMTLAWLDGAEQAFREHGGTLVIDRIDELTPPVQAAMLALIARLRRQPQAAAQGAVRVLCLAAADLAPAVAEKRFRQDLYYQVASVVLTVPPLRERPDDIPDLANRLIEQMNHHMGKRIERFSDGAVRRMKAYRWPGNVRELRSAVERAAILTTGAIVPPEHMMISDPADGVLEFCDELTLAEMERRLILKMLRRTGGNRSRTARMLGINRGTLYNKLRQYSIRDDHAGGEDPSEELQDETR